MEATLVRQGRVGSLIAGLMLAAIVGLPEQATALNFTLSDEALMAFDTVYKAQNAELVRKTDVPGPGVEYEIRLTSNTFSFFYGLPLDKGVLSRADYEQFDNYTLKFTYVKAVGSLPSIRNSGLVGAGCVLEAAYVNPWIAPVSKATEVASIRTDAMGGSEDWIGLNVTSWSPIYHNPAGAVITLRVEAEPSAVVIPEPGCLGLVALGGIALVGRRKG